MGTRDELERLQEMRREADEILLNLLRAPFYSMTPWARTTACHWLNHPTPRWTDERATTPCICGRRKGNEVLDDSDVADVILLRPEMGGPA